MDENHKEAILGSAAELLGAVDRSPSAIKPTDFYNEG